MAELIFAQMSGTIDEEEFIKAKAELKKRLEAARNRLLGNNKQEVVPEPQTAVAQKEGKSVSEGEKAEEVEGKQKKKVKVKAKVEKPKKGPPELSEEEKEIQEARRKDAARKVNFSTFFKLIYFYFLIFTKK